MALLVNGYGENIDFEEYHALNCGILCSLCSDSRGFDLQVIYEILEMHFFPWIDFFFSNSIWIDTNVKYQSSKFKYSYFESTEKYFLFYMYQKLEGKNENEEEISATPRL